LQPTTFLFEFVTNVYLPPGGGVPTTWSGCVPVIAVTMNTRQPLTNKSRTEFDVEYPWEHA
jgi:hypothetical protein